MGDDIIKHQDKPTFSGIVKEEVDGLQIRDYYKGVDDKKLAIHAQHIIQQLLDNFAATQTGVSGDAISKNTVTQPDMLNDKSLVVQSTNSFLDLAPVLQTEQGMNMLYKNMSKIIKSSPDISPNDKLLGEAVMIAIAELQFDIEYDIKISKDLITEMVTTTRVPNWDKIRHHIEKQGDKDVGFTDRGKASGKSGVEELFRTTLSHIQEDFGIDQKFRDRRLSRLMKDGINVLSHTPFEYFHTFEELRTNKKDRRLYMIRTYTHYDASNDKNASIVCFLDSDYNLLCPDFPAIDDSHAGEFFATSAFGNYTVGRYGGGLFFRYKYQIFGIKKGAYIQPPIANELANEEFLGLEVPEKGGGFIVSTKTHNYASDGYLKVLGKDAKDVEKKLLKSKK